MKILYIYKITNLLNDKCYVGKHSCLNINNAYFGSGIAIKKAIKKHGKNNFKKEILCICKTEEEQNKKEILWIKKLKTYKNGYNMTLGGEGILGHKHRADSIIKGSNSRREFYVKNPDVRKKLSDHGKLRTGALNPFFGKKLSVEHIEKMRVARVNAITGANNPSSVTIMCIETEEVFTTAKDAAIFCGLKHSTSILKCAKGQLKIAGGYTWKILPK